MKDNLSIIKCPVCGQEYMPGEVYLPKSFFGEQKEIFRDNSGKIDFYLGEDMDLDEEFVCESCLTKLKIRANLTFDITPTKEDEEYVTVVDKPSKIKLEEDSLFNH